MASVKMSTMSAPTSRPINIGFGTPAVLTSQLIGPSNFKQMSPVTLQRDSKTQMHEI
jgi:hypothetical protein